MGSSGASRRGAMVLAVVAGGVALALAGTMTAGPAGRPPRVHGAVPRRRPNIVLIVTDDQRTDTIGPRLMPQVWSILRRRGRAYPNAAVPTSLCCPSRASILTGQFAHSTRIYTNSRPHGGWWLFHHRGLERRTIAVALQAAGYHTGLVGKFLNHSAGWLSRGHVPPGWDRFVSFTTRVGYYDYTLTQGRHHGHRPSDYSTDVLARYAARFIRSAPAARPLFLYFATPNPHSPYTAAPRDQGRWRGRLPSYHPASVRENVADKPPWVRRWSRMPQARIDADRAKAQASLLSVDDAVGRLATALRDTGRIHDTLFIYLSDNGLMFGEHHLRGLKAFPYRWSTSIPMLLRWDGHVAPDTTDRRLALNVDLAATISRAARVPMDTEGLDLLGRARRSGFPLESARWVAEDGSRAKHPAYCGYRTRHWMFAQYASGFRELYDYRRDPQELRNRAYDRGYRTKVRRLRHHARDTCRPVPPGFHW